MALIFAIILVIPVQYFLIQPFVVSDASMSPGFHKGDLVLISRWGALNDSFKRGDLIVFREDKVLKNKHLRRIVGLPGERVVVKDGFLEINGKQYEISLFANDLVSIQDIGDLDAHEYFILPDASFEKPFGMIDKRFIIGKPLVRIYPFNRIKVY